MPLFNRYFEPFVGGGSVFMAINAKEYLINDFSSELIELYRNIANNDQDFFRYAMLMDLAWQKSLSFFKANLSLVDTYLDYRKGILTKDLLEVKINSFCSDKHEEITSIVGEEFDKKNEVLIKEIKTNLLRKMVRMRKLEKEKHELPAKDLHDNIETAIKSAVYMYFRYLYNDKVITNEMPKLHCALFFFMRNYAYSGMFRYSSKGDFNVPYGGIAYNSKLMVKKLNYYRSKNLHNRFKKTHIYNFDFEEFLTQNQPAEDDFIFLDPPYDSEFSTYAQHAFTQEDQRRLANYLIKDCKAKWMLVIKNTEFIYSLYDKKGIHIRMFDKEYIVSFMNRNEKKVTHLIITNYDL